MFVHGTPVQGSGVRVGKVCAAQVHSGSRENVDSWRLGCDRTERPMVVVRGEVAKRTVDFVRGWWVCCRQEYPGLPCSEPRDRSKTA